MIVTTEMQSDVRAGIIRAALADILPDFEDNADADKFFSNVFSFQQVEYRQSNGRMPTLRTVVMGIDHEVAGFYKLGILQEEISADNEHYKCTWFPIKKGGGHECT